MSPMQICLAAFIAAFVAVGQPAAAQEKDELWEVTTKMEMPGMPMAMPPQTSRTCIAKGSKEDSFIPRKGGECKTVESNRSGGKYTFKMVCEGRNKMVGIGEVNFAEGSYDGRMQLTGTMDGQPLNMTQAYSGKRVGACTAPPK
ncbi:MAG: DUF3617 family protein [Betaproteobacteria bacterium]